MGTFFITCACLQGWMDVVGMPVCGWESTVTVFEIYLGNNFKIKQKFTSLMTCPNGQNQLYTN